MRTGYTTRWVAEAGADKARLRAQHQRVFPGNQLAVVRGYIKVAVLDGETHPAGSITTGEARALWAARPVPDGNMRV